MVRMILLVAMTIIALLPVQVEICRAEETVRAVEDIVQLDKVTEPETEKTGHVKTAEPEAVGGQEDPSVTGAKDNEVTPKVEGVPEEAPPVAHETSEILHPPVKGEEGISTPILLGLGAAVLVGSAVAVGSSGGGGGGGDSTSTTTASAPVTAPTADSLVSAWQATGNQVGSGLTYTGVFQLFQGGGLAYNLIVSDGEHLVGGGGWRLDGYTLTMRTDHGSIYSGTVNSGTITAIDLHSNTAWNLHLTR